MLRRSSSKNNVQFLILVRNNRQRIGKALRSKSCFKIMLEKRFFLVFDADNIIPDMYLKKINELFCKGYDATFTKVYRHSSRFHGRLLGLDTVIWYDIILYSLKKISKGYIPLSAEGLV